MALESRVRIPVETDEKLFNNARLRYSFGAAPSMLLLGVTCYWVGSSARAPTRELPNQLHPPKRVTRRAILLAHGAPFNEVRTQRLVMHVLQCCEYALDIKRAYTIEKKLGEGGQSVYIYMQMPYMYPCISITYTSDTCA